MAHDHHSHHQDHGTGNIVAAFWLNFLFCIFEFAGGFYTNSIAIVADALHDLGDSFSLGLAWYFQKVSKRKRDANFTYGYKRFSLLGAIINSLVLVIGSVFILMETIPRLLSPEKTNAKGMLIFALVGILVNGIAMLRLRKGKSLNERVVSLHLLEDILGWVAILVGSIVLLFADVPLIDPLLSIGITLYVLFNVYRNMKEVFRVILQGIPQELSEETLRNSMLANEAVKDVHDLHVWTIDNEYHVLTAHLVLHSELTMPETEILKSSVKKILHDEFHIEHATIETELEEDDCELKDC